MKIIELTAIGISRNSGGSHGVVGYFTDEEKLVAAKDAFPREDWDLHERELRLDQIFCRPAGPDLLQSCIAGEMHGINPPSAKAMAIEIERNQTLANLVRTLWMAGFLSR